MSATGHRFLRSPSVRVFDEEGRKSVMIRIRTGKSGGAVFPSGPPPFNYIHISPTDRLPVWIGLVHAMSGHLTAVFLHRLLEGPYTRHARPNGGPRLRDLLTPEQVSRLIQAVERGLMAIEEEDSLVPTRRRPLARTRGARRQSARRSRR